MLVVCTRAERYVLGGAQRKAVISSLRRSGGFVDTVAFPLGFTG